MGGAGHVGLRVTSGRSEVQKVVAASELGPVPIMLTPWGGGLGRDVQEFGSSHILTMLFKRQGTGPWPPRMP